MAKRKRTKTNVKIRKKRAKTKSKIKISPNMQILITIAIIIGFFVALFLIKYIKGPKTTDTIDDLVDKTIKGEIDESKGYLYNGFSFVKQEGLWFTQIQKKGTSNVYNVQLRYGPKELENITIQGNPNEFLDLTAAYITFDPVGRDLSHVALAASDLSSNMAVVLAITPVPACTKNETGACKDIPTITCDNTKNPVIFIKEDAEAKIIHDDNCITLQGWGMDLVKVVDRLMLGWYGIMPFS
ncbi:hypothetical protein KY339_02260 [Candidatus Woesearchaeota archaeon]|nr:hypothetical protein [Candidatus Woesearchaeota archaeon]